MKIHWFQSKYVKNIFRCYVTHRIPVSYPYSRESDNNKHSQEPINYVGGTFSQFFEVKASPGSILILKSPKQLEEGLVGGNISLECEAETAPDISSSSGTDSSSLLQYQW